MCLSIITNFSRWCFYKLLSVHGAWSTESWSHRISDRWFPKGGRETISMDPKSQLAKNKLQSGLAQQSDHK